MSDKPGRKYPRALVWGMATISLLFLVFFLLDYYEVYSSSMVPVLHPGDYVVVLRLTYDRHPTGRAGDKTIAFFKLGSVKKGDIVVFNKPLWQFHLTDTKFCGEEYVKRCYGVPGDSIFIDSPALRTGYGSHIIDTPGMQVFTQDSSLKWSNNKMGPLWVPRQGASIVLDKYNLILYRKILESEGYPFPADRTAFLRKGEKERIYTFKYDYYFFLGDNFYESFDSRRWGFVPRFSLLGKVILTI